MSGSGAARRGPAIALRGVSREYVVRPPGRLGLLRRARRRQIYRDLSLEVPRGSVLGVTGANGSGKTTLLKLMAGLFLPTAGSVRVAGLDTCVDGARVRALVGFSAASERSLFWRLSGRQNLEFISSLDGVPRDERLAALVAELTALLQLEHELDLTVEGYSAGMKEKLGYIATLLHPRRVLIYDDFGKNLDRPGLDRLWARLRGQVDRGELDALVISSPRRELLARLVDRVLVVDRGGVHEADGDHGR